MKIPAQAWGLHECGAQEADCSDSKSGPLVNDIRECDPASPQPYQRTGNTDACGPNRAPMGPAWGMKNATPWVR